MTIPAGLTWRPEFRPQHEDGPESSRANKSATPAPNNPNAKQGVPDKGGKQGAQQSCMDPQMMMMLVLMVGVFYFFLIRPQQKQEKELKAMRSTLKKGDRVVTTGGMHGFVHQVDGDKIQLRSSADGPIMTFESSAVGRVVVDEAKADTDKADGGKDGK